MPEARTVLNEIEKSTKDILNAKIDFIWVDYAEYANKVQQINVAGEPVDAFICGMPGPELAFNFIEMARKGELYDITQIFPSAAPDLYKKYSSEEISTMKVDGKIYVIPSLYPVAYATNLWVKKDLITKYHLTPIRSLEDYDSFLRRISRSESDLYAGQIGPVDVDTFARLFGYVVLDNRQRLVYKWDDLKMQIVAWEQTPEFNEIIKYITGWNESGYLKSPNEITTESDVASLLVGSDPSVAEEVVTITSFEENTKKITEYYRYHLYPGSALQRMNPIGNIFSKGAIAFSSRSKNVERSLLFLDWIQREQKNYDMLMYGIEGKHYTLNEGNLRYIDMKSYNTLNGYSAFFNIDYMRAASKDTYIDFINTKSQYPPHIGLCIDYTSVQSEASARSEIFDNKIDRKLHDGKYIFDDTKAIVEELNQVGTGMITKVVQRQLDAWVGKDMK
jgi:putative aldouronate transport system substrate-binding protein